MSHKIHDAHLDPDERQLLVEELQLARREPQRDVRTVAGLGSSVGIRPADSRRRSESEWTGRVQALRQRSLLAKFDHPLEVGSFYEVALEPEVADVERTFARCDQVTFLAEDQFETRFVFLQPVEPANSTVQADS